ncbi:class I SAM-dependent methyltransferase [Paralimibaculum aggregatum]|uniref:Class I SAM-dependent methyltransferase n=1 Tax=Paralimibaculum aggregatum TaxID=3036245 RepID=A0ABQ6LKJ8_9RHOB|nr:class I SAM-dependent methyltransferase [Limibaculum sp. NKW23]GMG83775.1 class I SAM-dependent methyltransferase [Limibaculum sp. NKW23]
MTETAKTAGTAGAEQTEFVRFWNEILVPKFVTYKHVLVGGLSRHSDAILPGLDVVPGMRVLDAGCGFGDTACWLAEQVGPSGEVVGIDCCDGFLDYGRREAAARGLGNIVFAEADVESHPFEGDFDMVFSRFGTMFFSNPVAALRNMRRALKPGGKLTHIVWRNRADNPWLSAARDVVLRHLPPPGEDAQTCGPGPFSMADQETVTGQMHAAGYSEIVFERVDAMVRMGDDIEDAIGFQIALGPAGEVYREAGDLALAKEAEIKADLAALLRPHVTSDGIWMGSSSWVISARNAA